jgi:hypothetical protein
VRTNGELKYQALTMWANYLETGTPTLSAADLRQQAKSNEIKHLNPHQQATVEHLKQLALRELIGDKTPSGLPSDYFPP